MSRFNDEAVPGILSKVRKFIPRTERQQRLHGKWKQVTDRIMRREDGAMVISFTIGWETTDYLPVHPDVLTQAKNLPRSGKGNWYPVSPRHQIPTKRGTIGRKPKVTGPLSHTNLKNRVVTYEREDRAMAYVDDLYPPKVGYLAKSFSYPRINMTDEQRDKYLNQIQRLKYGKYQEVD